MAESKTNAGNDDKALLEQKMQEFPNSKALLISSKRPKTFLVRTACELLAGGTEVLILSALGDAMGLCLQLQMLLTSRNAATTFRIETLLNKCVYEKTRNPFHIPGILVYMKKHPEFKGSRISPGYIVFSPQSPSGFTPPFEESPSEAVCSVNAGNGKLTVGGGGINAQFASLLSGAGHDLQAYTTLFSQLLQEAVLANDENPKVFVATTLETQLSHPDLNFALCRLPKNKSVFKGTNEGIVFVCTFKEKFPHGNSNNFGFLYVVGPDGSNYDSIDGFLDSVHQVGENLVTALCDYNGMAKRESSKKMTRIQTCRICLISGGIFKHSGVSKLDVAKSLLNGIAEGYRHGPAPRFNFAYDDDVFRTAWVETTGLKASVPSDGN